MITPENPSPHDRVIEFFGGDVDEHVIQDYLKLAQSSEIARLAAMMAPRPKKFDADALVDQAIELNSAAERGLVRKRETMVASLNYSTLLQLLTHLGVPLELIYLDGDDPKFRDPLTGPPLRFVWEVLTRSSKLDSTRQKEAIQDGLNKLRNAHGPLPQFPCDLITILRYASLSKTIPDDVLIAAFTDFLGLYQSAMKREDEEEIRKKYAELESLKKHRGSLAPPLQAYLDQSTSDLMELNERQQYRDTFTPGGKSHSVMEAKGKSIFKTYWSENRQDFNERNLIWIAEEFTTFLKTHGSKYEALHRKQQREMQALTRARAQAGGKGARTREENRWKHYTEKLCYYMRSKERQSAKKPRDLLEAFVGTEIELRSSKAKKEFLEFFGAVWISATREPEVLSVLRKLRPKLSVETIRGVRQEVKSALEARENK